jgi:hypothetical protein
MEELPDLGRVAVDLVAVLVGGVLGFIAAVVVAVWLL